MKYLKSEETRLIYEIFEQFVSWEVIVDCRMRQFFEVLLDYQQREVDIEEGT